MPVFGLYSRPVASGRPRASVQRDRPTESGYLRPDFSDVKLQKQGELLPHFGEL